MKRVTCALVGALLLALVAAPAGAGYDAYIDGASCLNADGAGCTHNGTDGHGRTVMRCAAGTAGSFDCPLTITSQASTSLTVRPASAAIVNVNSVTGNDNLCWSITTYVMTEGANASAAMSGGTESDTVSVGLLAAGCSGTFFTDGVCYVGDLGVAAVAAYDLEAAGDCSGTYCTDRQAWVRVQWKAACSGAVATGNWDFPWLKLGVQ